MQAIAVLVALMCLVALGQSADTTLFPIYKAADVPGLTAQNNTDFKARVVAGWVSPFVTGGVFMSLDVTSDFANSTESATGSPTGKLGLHSLAGATFVKFNGFPTSIMGYFDFDFAVSNLTDLSTVNFSSSVGIMASAYLKLEEVNIFGTVVDSQKFNNFLSYSWSIDYSETGISPDGKIQWITVVGARVLAVGTVKLTYIMAAEPMVLNIANVRIAPKSYECIVRIDNWSYKNSNNRLRLSMLTATGSAAVGKAGGTLNIDAGKSELYFNMGSTAMVDGSERPVEIGDWVFVRNDQLSDLLPNLGLNQLDLGAVVDSIAAIATKYGNGTNTLAIGKIDITFPANAGSILYDPTTGTGTSFASLFVSPAPLAPNGTSTLSPESLVIVAATTSVVGVALIASVVVVVVVFRSRALRRKVLPYKDSEGML